MVQVGDPAPRAKIKLITPDKYISNYSLEEIYNSSKTIVFYFFPAAFTGVCTKSSCELRDDIDEFASIGADIYGISVNMPTTHQVFIEMNDINYPLLSDFNKEMIKAFDIVDNTFGDLIGVAKRSLFVVHESKIIFKWIAEHPGKYPPFDEVKRIIQSQ